MLTAAYLTASFLVVGVGAYYLLRGKHIAFARKSVAMGTAFATVLIGCQVFIGDILYGTMLKYQPSKMQAAEGFWQKESPSPAPYYWIIVPDQKHERNRIAWGIPVLGSVWLTHSLKGRVEGLKNTPPDQRPIMGMVFYGFRIMYGLAIVMFSVAITSLYLRWTGRLYAARWFLKLLVIMTPSGIVATLAGWYLAETGRQPWVIYGLLRTADAVSPVPPSALLSTLIAFICIYSIFMGAFLVFSWRIVRRGPDESPAQTEASGSIKQAFRPEILDRKEVDA
jgi:cytochrome d ubiquinol oxidase subunit I